MRRCMPDRKWRKLLKSIEDNVPPADLGLAHIYAVINGTDTDENVEYALDLIREPLVRDRVVAYLLSGATMPEISSSLWIPIEILDLFQDLVVNRQEFRHKLELHMYAQRYIEEIGSEGCDEWIRLGLEVGPTALIFKHIHGHEDLPVDSRMITREVIQQAFHIGKIARANPIGSTATKEAFKWMGAAARFASTYDKQGMDDGTETEAIASIERRKMTNTPDEVDIAPEDIIH